jgi:hypothetical protein
MHFRDTAQWRRFSMSTGQRAFWRFVPEESRGPLYDQATQVLEEARTDGGDIVLLQDVQYTLGAVASPPSPPARSRRTSAQSGSARPFRDPKSSTVSYAGRSSAHRQTSGRPHRR